MLKVTFGRLAAIASAICLISSLAQAQTSEPAQAAPGSRLSGLKLSAGEPIQIESDKLEVRENDSMAIFSGNVSVVQGKTLLKSGKMTVFYTKGGEGSAATGSSNIERLEVDEKVYVKSDNQIATGDHGEFDMLSETLVLSGKEVVLSEGENVLVGCKLTVQMQSGLAQVDGCASGEGGGQRVKMLLQPGSQSQ